MKLCVSSHMLGVSGSIEEFRQTLDFNKKVGFEEIDFAFDTPMMLREGWKEDFRAKLAIAEEAGVPIRYAHLPFDYPGGNRAYGWEDFVLASRRAIDLAIEAGADCAAIHPRTWMKTDYDAEKEHEAALSFLAPYCEYAEKAGLTLGLENMRGGGRSAPPDLKRYATETGDLIRLADELGVGICWDTGHEHCYSDLDFIDLYGDRLIGTHINDNLGRSDSSGRNDSKDDLHLLPFDGEIDWKEIARRLKSTGFEGPLTFELKKITKFGQWQKPEYLEMSMEEYVTEAYQRAVKFRDYMDQM